MKKRVSRNWAVAAAIVVSLGTTMFNSCKKAESSAAKTVKMSTSSITGVTLNSGVPVYEDLATFQSIMSQLQSDFAAQNASAQSYFGITGDTLTDSAYDAGLANTIVDYTLTPLTTFESSVGFTSLRYADHNRMVTWLSTQTGDSLDTTRPVQTPIGIIMKTMVNDQGIFAIGDSIYLITPSLKTYVVGGIANMSTMQNIAVNQATVSTDWPSYQESLSILGINAAQINTGGSGANQNGCAINRHKRFKNISVNNESRYKCDVDVSIYDDFVKTSCITEIDAYYKTRLIGWVFALTNLRASKMLYHYDDNCGDMKSVSTNEFNWWGWTDLEQNNFWGAWRQIHAPVDINTDGFFGRTRCKNLSYQEIEPLDW